MYNLGLKLDFLQNYTSLSPVSPIKSLNETNSGAESRDNNSNDRFSTFKNISAQVIATTVNNFLLVNISLVICYPTILLAALLNNTDESSIHLTDEQATWFASISLICQPVGSIFAGALMEPIGRKRTMLLVNIPYFIGWTTIYFARSVAALNTAAGILGFAIGCTEAPMLTYVGEITEPNYRGALTAYCQLSFQIASVVIYTVGSFVNWRYVSAFCALVPLVAAMSATQVPESPFWLISRGKIQQAREALCWLRGWKQPEEVQEELNELILYYQNVEKEILTPDSKSITNNPGSQEILIDSQMSIKQKIVYFFRPEMRRPLILVISYFFFIFGSGLQTIRPYFVIVFSELNITTEYYLTTVLVAVLGVIGAFFCVVIVPYIGKRKLSFISFVGCGLCTFFLALVAYNILSSSSSFPLMLAYSFFTSLGIFPIPWILQSEVYPYKGKCLAAGIASAACYIFGFIAIKSYLALKEVLELSGTFVLFTLINGFGMFYLSLRMPETEGKSFEEIQKYFVKYK